MKSPPVPGLDPMRPVPIGLGQRVKVAGLVSIAAMECRSGFVGVVEKETEWNPDCNLDPLTWRWISAGFGQVSGVVRVVWQALTLDLQVVVDLLGSNAVFVFACVDEISMLA